MRRGLRLISLVMLLAAVAACGGTDASTPNSNAISVSPENSAYLVGADRLAIALLDQQRNPVAASDVQLHVVNVNGVTVDTQRLQDIGPEYGGIHTYIGSARFPDVGQYRFDVTATVHGGEVSSSAYVTVTKTSTEVPVGAHVPLVRQAVLGDPGVTLATLDSAVPPDTWHSTTIAAGVAEHRPMVLFFGDPAYCPSRTCGPTHQILEQLCTRFCSSLLFEHIETYLPAGPPGPTAHVNPAFTAFGLQTDPWIYFVNAEGVVSDRYEGPVTLSELTQSAEGTLAGKVPAVVLG